MTFDDLFERYHQEIYRLCIGMLADTAEAEDATQEVFLRAHRAWHTYNSHQATARTWLGHITLNYCRSVLRRRRIFQFIPFTAKTIVQSDRSLMNHDSRIDLHKALQTLDEQHRSVVVLRYYLDLPCAAIAEILRVSEGTVHSRLYTARRRLHIQLSVEK
jgi:RNA polymerase sigma-70 factor (ECF subfamily)